MRLITPVATSAVTALALACTLSASASITKPVRARLSAEAHGDLVLQPIEQQEPVMTRAMAAGVDMIPPPAIVLGPVDVDGLLLEDESADTLGPKRFAIQRRVDLKMSDGQWIAVEGGSVWRLDFDGMGSLNTRMHLSGLSLGEGEEIFLSTPGDAESVVGPLTGVGPNDNGEAWGVFAQGPVARIEWFVPEGRKVDRLPFDSAEYSHGYQDPFTPRAGTDKASGCVIDPVCYPDWANVSNAVGQMTYSDTGGSYVCSGQLIATTAADETPLFLTARHCISTTAQANSLQIYFKYRATTCNGATPFPSTANRVIGTDLVSSYAGSDCTLVMIRQALPAGLFWVGWQNTNPSNGTQCTGIHHPNGVEQDISFGSKTGLSNLSGCLTGTVSNASSVVTYSTGVTEGGSSGSGIYVNGTQRLFGVLSCGPTNSSCTNILFGLYGRLDLAISGSTTFASALAAGSDDTQEENDTCAAAKVLTAGTYSNLVIKRVDEDWYAIDMPAGAQLSVSSTYLNSYGDVDFQLYNTCSATTTLAQDTGNVNNAAFSFTNSLSTARRVYLRVFVATGTRNTYSLTLGLTVPPPVNNECNAAISVGNETVNFDTTYATNSAVTIPSSCNAGGGTAINKDIWYQYVADCDGTATATTCGTAGFDTNLVVYGSTSCPTASTAVLACNDQGTGCSSGSSVVSWPVTAGNAYYVRLGSPGAASGTGSITFGCETPPPACPADLDGSSTVDAGDIAAILLVFGECPGTPCAGDLDGNGAVDAGDIASMLLVFGNCP